MNDFDYDYGADYYSEAYGAEARAIASHEDYMSQIEDDLIAKIAHLQNCYNRTGTCYAALEAAKAELAELREAR